MTVIYGKKLYLTLNEIKPGMVTANKINLYNKTGKLVMTVRSRIILSDEMINRLARHGLKETEVYYSVDFVPDLTEDEVDEALEIDEASVEDKIDAVPEDTNIQEESVEGIIDESLRIEVVDSIRRLFDALGEGGNMTTAYQAVRELDNILDYLVDTISSESNAFVHITDLKSFDEYTYHHSLSVAVLAIAIGTGLGLNIVQLKKLGQCAILHDIGKTGIPLEIINKASKLTDEEFNIIKGHALKSGEYLERSNIGDAEIWSTIVHHHEKMDGSGYPDKLKGDDIPLYSRIISVADVYDAVTSYRPYRDPMSPNEAVELIMSGIGSSFDYRIVKVFIDKLELYPINSVLVLTNNRLGKVVDNTINLRPILRMLDDDSLLDLMSLDNLSLVITKMLDKSV